MSDSRLTCVTKTYQAISIECDSNSQWQRFSTDISPVRLLVLKSTFQEKRERFKELIEFPAHRHRCATGAQRGRLLGAHLELSTAWLVRTMWFPHTSLHLRRLAVNHEETWREKTDALKSVHLTRVPLGFYTVICGQSQDLNMGARTFKGLAGILLRLNFRRVTYNPAVCHHVKCLLCRSSRETNHAALNSTTAPSAVC